MEQWEERLIELEIRLALQDELLQSLNDTVAKLNETLALQQAQLRLLYQRSTNIDREADNKSYGLIDEIPPHY